MNNRISDMRTAFEICLSDEEHMGCWKCPYKGFDECMKCLIEDAKECIDEVYGDGGCE